MSVHTYNPNSPATVNALTQAHILKSALADMQKQIDEATNELNTFIKVASCGGVIDSLSAPDPRKIEEAAWALKAATKSGDTAYMLANAMRSCTETFNLSRLDLIKA